MRSGWIPSSRISVRSFSGPEREIEAEDLRFLNDLRVLAMVRVPDGLELRAASLDDAQDVTWRQPLPDVRDGRLDLDTGLGLWRVIGTAPRSGLVVDAPPMLDAAVAAFLMKGDGAIDQITSADYRDLVDLLDRHWLAFRSEREPCRSEHELLSPTS